MTTCVAIVPAYRAGATLQRTLDSLLRLNGETIERVLVVCSDAESAQAAGCAAKVERVVCRRRLSAGAARNLGASLVDSELLLFVDADCELPRGGAARLIAQLDQTRADAIGASIADAGRGAAAGVRHLLEFKDYDPRARRALDWMLPSTALLCRRRSFDRAGGFPDLWPGEDLVFSYRLTRRGGRLVKSDEVVARHLPPAGIADLLAHQRRLGATSAAARRLTGMPGAAASESVCLVPFVCGARLLRALLWIARCDVRRSVRWLSRLPLLALALLSWGGGFAATTLSASADWDAAEGAR